VAGIGIGIGIAVVVAMAPSWVRLTATSLIPCSSAIRAASPLRARLHHPAGSRRTSMDRQSGWCPTGRSTFTMASLAANRAASPAATTDGEPWQQATSCSV